MRDLPRRAEERKALREDHKAAIEPPAEQLPEPVDEDRIHPEHDERERPSLPAAHVDQPVDSAIIIAMTQAALRNVNEAVQRRLITGLNGCEREAQQAGGGGRRAPGP